MQEDVQKLTQRWKGIGVAFLSGQAVSILGSGLVQFAIIWFVTLRANSGTALMIITLTSFIPQLVVAPFAGVWADRHDRRWLIILSDSAIALVTLATALLFFFGYDRVWMIYIAAAIRSLGGGIQSPAIKALIPQITPKSELVRLNGFYSTIDNIVLLLSPVIGGALITLFPVWIVFMVDVVTAAIAVTIMLWLPIPHQRTGKVLTATGREPKLKVGSEWGFPSREELELETAAAQAELEDVDLPHEPVMKQFSKGFAYVKKHVVIRNLMLVYALFMVLLSPIATLFPLFIRRHFDSAAWRISAAQTAVFTGMAAGGLAVSIKGYFKSKLKTIRRSGFLVAAGTLGLAFFGVFDSPLFGLFIGLAFGLGTIVPFYTTAVTTFFQEQVERAYHGRVFSLLYMIGSAAIPFGAVIFGPLADVFPIAYLLFFTSAVQILILLVSWRAIPKDFKE